MGFLAPHVNAYLRTFSNLHVNKTLHARTNAHVNGTKFRWM